MMGGKRKGGRLKVKREVKGRGKLGKRGIRRGDGIIEGGSGKRRTGKQWRGRSRDI